MSKFSRQIYPSDRLSPDFVPQGMFQYIQNFWILKLNDHQETSLSTNSLEVGIIVLSGKCIIEVQGLGYPTVNSELSPYLGSRKSIFEGLPTAVYIPIEEKYKIIAQGNVELAICGGKCETKTQPALIQPKDVKVMSVGRDNWQREVRIIIGPKSPSVGMIIGETLNPPGNWSGTPAHKHDELNPPHERIHEELYFFKMEKPTGFGIQRLYSPRHKIDELMLLENDTLTFIPYGYHQIVAAPGYRLYYLFFLCGQDKELVASFDPQHKWLLGDKK